MPELPSADGYQDPPDTSIKLKDYIMPLTPLTAEQVEQLKTLRANGTFGLSYNIQINEYQRVLLQLAVKFMIDNNADQLTAMAGDLEGDALEESKAMFDMLGDDLVKVETEDPGITHGFCV